MKFRLGILRVVMVDVTAGAVVGVQLSGASTYPGGLAQSRYNTTVLLPLLDSRDIPFTSSLGLMLALSLVAQGHISEIKRVIANSYNGILNY